MALTTLQREVCRLLADRRKASGESYVAGGAALNEGGPATLRDDLAAGRLAFHPGRIRGAFPTIRG